MILRVAVVSAGLAGHVRRFYLNDLRAHFSHDACGEGAGNIGTGHEYLYAGQHAELREIGKRHMSAVIIRVMCRHYSAFLSFLV